MRANPDGCKPEETLMRKYALGALAVFALTFLAPTRAYSQGGVEAAKSKTAGSEPCCGIISIDSRTMTVTAREISTGHTFQFKVENRRVLAGLKVGGKVYTDFAAGKVSADGIEVCCTIIGAQTQAAKTQRDPAEPAGVSAKVQRNPAEPAGITAKVRPDAEEPCCAVTAIDARTGTITAKVSATGRTFQFRLSDRAALAGLRVGQQVWADFTAKRVGVKPQEPCCGIVGAVPE
jgi:Cu/Ag efflux protein CusF